MSTLFGRVMTAMITPLDNNGDINWNKVRELSEYLVQNGTDTIVVCGTTGESPTLTKDEKLRMFETVLDAVGNQAKVIAGSGSNSTADTIALSQAAERIGVHGVMLVVPYYNKPCQEALYNHFAQAATSVKLPVMLYNVPSRTGINMLPEIVERLASLENIVALKEAAGDMDQVSELVRRLPKDFAIYSGDDSLTLPMLALGCRGVVSVASHIIGTEIQQMVDAYQKGDVNRASEIHNRLFPIFKTLFITSNPVPLKAALNLKGMGVGGLRPPLIEANKDEMETVRKEMSKLSLI